MRRVNLLRSAPDRRESAGGSIGSRRGALGCSLVLTLAWCGLGLSAFRLHGESTRLDRDVARARQEVSRLRTVVARAAALRLAVDHLQEQAEVLERFRAAQRAPLGVLGEIRRSLPDDTWLTAITEEAADVVRIEGRAAALSSLFAFVDRLQASSAIGGRVEVLESRAGAPDPEGDLAAFAVRVSVGSPGPSVGSSTNRHTPQVATRTP